MNSFYSADELSALGFKSFGENVLISKKASVYGAQNIEIGNNVRVDDFCILSGKIKLGDYIHVSAGTYLYGGSTGIFMENFSGISARSVVYAESDDYSGNVLTNSMVPEEYRNVICGEVHIKKYVQVGAGCTILPGVVIGEGSAVGSMALINRTLDEWGIYAGVPCRKLKDRSKRLLELEAEIVKDLDAGVKNL